MENINSEDKLRNRAKILTEQFGGVLPQQEVFYIASIQYSSGRALELFELFESSKGSLDPEGLTNILQEALIHVAALSRYFWPTGRFKKKQTPLENVASVRGIKLRSAFDVSDDASIKCRDSRNAWEHFDERLDQYLIMNDSGCFYPDCQIGSHTQADEEVVHIFKLLDLECSCLVLMNEKYFFGEIHQEVKRVYNKTLEFTKTGRLS